METAHRAAAALQQAMDPGQVLLFGSVACGTQHPDSDLDLVLVFDDLGDYTKRQALARQARGTILDTTGLNADVRVTDRAEWNVRTEQCRSTFEAHIAAHAVTLSSRPPKAAIDWDKEIGMAPSDDKEAAHSLANANNALNKLLAMLRPSPHEDDALLAGDLSFADRMKHSRMLGICEQSQIAMETSLKALIHALHGGHPGRVHGIDALLTAAVPQLGPEDAAQLQAALGPVSPHDASVWRETGTYPADIGIDGDPASATPRFSGDLAAAAAGITRTSIAIITRLLGHQSTEAELALDLCQRITQELRSQGSIDRGLQDDAGS